MMSRMQMTIKSRDKIWGVTNGCDKLDVISCKFQFVLVEIKVKWLWNQAWVVWYCGPKVSRVYGCMYMLVWLLMYALCLQFFGDYVTFMCVWSCCVLSMYIWCTHVFYTLVEFLLLSCSGMWWACVLLCMVY